MHRIIFILYVYLKSLYLLDNFHVIVCANLDRKKEKSTVNTDQFFPIERSEILSIIWNGKRIDLQN